MKTGGLPPGLASLLGKLGLATPPGGQKGETKVAKDALHGGPQTKGLEKGTPLADGVLLAGLGHTPEDRHAAQRNVVEQSNIDRFLQDPNTAATGRDLPEQFKAGDAERMREGRDAREGKEAREGVEARETRELRDDMRRDDRVDESKQQALHDQKAKEKEEEREGRERDKDRGRDRERERDQDEEEKPGGAWVQEELDQREEDKKRRSGIRDEDTLGSGSRCRGHVEDGSRCLRKPMQGTPYCREHAFVK